MTLALVYVKFIFLKMNFDVFQACDTDIKLWKVCTTL